MRIFVWLIRAALFFTLFAFALNNQHPVAIRWFFNHEWRAPMVFIVLAAFTLGCIVGGLAMAPSWWRHRRIARQHQARIDADLPLDPNAPVPDAPPPIDSEPSRHGV